MSYISWRIDIYPTVYAHILLQIFRLFSILLLHFLSLFRPLQLLPLQHFWRTISHNRPTMFSQFENHVSCLLQFWGKVETILLQISTFPKLFSGNRHCKLREHLVKIQKKSFHSVNLPLVNKNVSKHMLYGGNSSILPELFSVIITTWRRP